MEDKIQSRRPHRSLLQGLRYTLLVSTKIFKCNLIINQCYNIDRETIREGKEDLIIKGNECESGNQINYTYKQGDKVLLKYGWKTKFNHNSYLGPYIITTVRNNGTVRAKKGSIIGRCKS